MMEPSLFPVIPCMNGPYLNSNNLYSYGLRFIKACNTDTLQKATRDNYVTDSIISYLNAYSQLTYGFPYYTRYFVVSECNYELVNREI